jgi:hypothetical protein
MEKGGMGCLPKVKNKESKKQRGRFGHPITHGDVR